MIQKEQEQFETIIAELKTIQKGLPNGELKAIQRDIESMKDSISEIRDVLLNPETGIVVRVNKNTEYRESLKDNMKKHENAMEELNTLVKWKNSVNKALWIAYTALVGIILKLVLDAPLP